MNLKVATGKSHWSNIKYIPIACDIVAIVVFYFQFSELQQDITGLRLKCEIFKLSIPMSHDVAKKISICKDTA